MDSNEHRNEFDDSTKIKYSDTYLMLLWLLCVEVLLKMDNDRVQYTQSNG